MRGQGRTNHHPKKARPVKLKNLVIINWSFSALDTVYLLLRRRVYVAPQTPPPASLRPRQRLTKVRLDTRRSLVARILRKAASVTWLTHCFVVVQSASRNHCVSGECGEFAAAAICVSSSETNQAERCRCSDSLPTLLFDQFVVSRQRNT